MFSDLSYAYLIGNVILFVVWLALFLLRRDLRTKMIIMSILIAPLAPIAEIFYLRDYWRPEFFNGWKIGIEDPLFGFLFGGISCVMYEEVFGKYFAKRHARGHPIWTIFLVLFGILWMVVTNIVLGFNSMYASIVGFAIISACMLYFRHDLLRDALLSSVLLSLLFFILYKIYLFFFPTIFQSWWMFENMSGIFISGIPLEELVWAFSWGLFAGPAYEFTLGLRLVAEKKRLAKRYSKN